MLSILFLLVAAPQAHAPAPVAPPPPRQPQATMRVLGTPQPGCVERPLLANDPAVAGTGLMWREQGEPVALYRLLDRYIGGCPAPIIVNYRVPGSNAVGREIGRDFDPGALAAPRP